MLAQRARHPGAKFPAVVRDEKVLLAILPADSEAFGRPGRDLGREPPRPRAGRDEDVQLVGPAGVDAGEARERLQLFDLGSAALLHGDRDELVRVPAQPIALRQDAQLPLQDRPVEHAGRQRQLELEAERLHEAFAQDDDLVEPAFVDLDGDLLALDFGANGCQVVAGATEEAEQLRRQCKRLGGCGAGVLRQIERAPVDDLVEGHVAVELQQRPFGDFGGGRPGAEEEHQRRRRLHALSPTRARRSRTLAAARRTEPSLGAHCNGDGLPSGQCRRSWQKKEGGPWPPSTNGCYLPTFERRSWGSWGWKPLTSEPGESPQRPFPASSALRVRQSGCGPPGAPWMA